MAEKAHTRGAGKASSGRKAGTPSGGKAASSGSSHASSNGRGGGVSMVEAVQSGRDHLGVLLGRPVEAVLGVDREHGNWILRAQVLELARIPNTTDVLGEYEAVLDRNGELVRYSRLHRYHRGQVDSDQ
jgi:hypothetical protein